MLLATVRALSASGHDTKRVFIHMLVRVRPSCSLLGNAAGNNTSHTEEVMKA
jgi:hypothetical protein